MDDKEFAQEQQTQNEEQVIDLTQSDLFSVEPVKPTDSARKEDSTFSIISLVIGLVSLMVSCGGCYGLVGGIVGLVFGIISLVRNKGGRGMAIAGIIISAIALAVSLIVFFFITGIFFTGFMSELMYY